MKKLALLFLFIVQFVFVMKTYSQNIAINATGNQPDTSAMLDISSTTKGFLAPRMTTTQQNAIPLPATGLLIFNTTDNAYNVNTGTTVSPVWTPLSYSTGTIASLNGLTGSAQTFATGSTGTDFNIASGTNTHTFHIPSASPTARGLVTFAAQIFGGNKTFNGNIIAAGLTSGATTDSLVTADATGTLKKRTVASVLSGQVWTTGGNTPINSGNQFLGTINFASLRFRTNNLERMVLDSNGYIGLGITLPLKPIDIVKNMPNQGGLMQFRNSATNGYTSIDLQNEAGTQVANIGWGNATAGNFSNSFYMATNVSAPMFFSTDMNERMRILATGHIGIGTPTPTAILNLKAGTAAANTAPFKIDDGIVLTAIEKGTIEKDANVFYITPDATNRGVLPAVSFSILSSDFTLTNGNAAQAVFSSGQDVINLAASTTYEFEAQYKLATGVTNHSTSTLFAVSAALTDISYVAQLSSGGANAITTTLSTRNVNSVAAAPLNTASTNAETIIQLKGIIRTSTACTFIPQIQFSTAPGGTTNRCLENSYFKLTPIGINSVQKVGSWF